MPQLHMPNDILDVFRVLLFLVGLYTVVRMVIRYRTSGGHDWNVKTKDSWYALLMWAFAGMVFALQGIALDRPLTPGFIFMTAAILVSGKAVHRKGDWGSSAR